MSVQFVDLSGNAVRDIDFGVVYVDCARSTTTKKIKIINRNDDSVVIALHGGDELNSEDITVMVKFVCDYAEDSESHIVMELPQQELIIPPRSELEATVIASSRHVSTDIMSKKPMLTSSGRISSLLIAKWRLESSNIFSEISIFVKMQICISIMELDEADIEFDSCLVGNIYVRDVQIWNRSECDLLYRFFPINSLHSLPITFADFETGKKLDIGEPLQLSPYSSQRIRLSLNPKISCDISRAIRFQNEFNSANYVILNCHISVTSRESVDVIRLESELGVKLGADGQSFDFGQCYLGLEKVQRVWVRNTSGRSVEFNITSDCPAEVCFDTFDSKYEKWPNKSGKVSQRPVEDGIAVCDYSGGSVDERAPAFTSLSLHIGTDDKRDFNSDALREGLTNVVRLSSSSSRLFSPTYLRDYNSPKINSTNSSANKFTTQSTKSMDTGKQILEPGAKRMITIKFCPTINGTISHSHDHRYASSWSCQDSGGTLCKKYFKLLVLWKYKRSSSCHQETKQKQKIHSQHIQCRAQCCASVISVSPATLDLGECIVGQLRSATFTVKNDSDMMALVLPFVSSKSLEILEKELIIPPRGSRECHVEYVARTANESYVNTITVLNVFNSHCNVNIDILANNVDVNGIVELSSLYQLFTRNEKMQTQIYFDKCLSDMPNVRTFSIRNTSSDFLNFEFTTSSNSTVQIFDINLDSNDIKSKKTLYIEEMKWGKYAETNSREISSTHRFLKKTVDDEAIHVSSSHRDGSEITKDESASNTSASDRNQLEVFGSFPDNITGKLSRDVDFVYKMSTSCFPFCLLDRPDHITNSVTASSESTRESSSDVVIADNIALIHSCYEDFRRDLETGKFLSPVCTTDVRRRITLSPNETHEFVVVLTPSRQMSSRGDMDSQEMFIQEEVHLNLLLSNGDSTIIKSRSIPVRAVVLESEMVVAQRNINFGGQIVGETSTRALSISNKSNFALVYNILKSGSISSSFLNVLNGRRGVISAMSTKVIEFEFKPKLPGLFEEALTIENLLSGGVGHVVMIKANVSKCDLFTLLPEEILPTDNTEDDIAGDFNGTISELVAILMDRESIEYSHQLAPLSNFNLGVALASSRVSKSFQFRLQNPTSKQRSVLITFQSAIYRGIVEEDSSIRCHFIVIKRESSLRDDNSGSQTMTLEDRRRLLDKLETYHQKLKIARRKGKTEKEHKYLSKIDEINKRLELSISANEANEKPNDAKDSHSNKSFLIRGDRTPFTLDPEEIITIRVDVDFFLVTIEAELQSKCCVGALRVYEGKNEDNVKFLYFGVGIVDSSRISLLDSQIGNAASSADELLNSPIAPTMAGRNDGIYFAEASHQSEIELSHELTVRVDPAFGVDVVKKYPAITTAVKSLLIQGIEFKRSRDLYDTLHCDISVLSSSCTHTEFRMFWLHNKIFLDSNECNDISDDCGDLEATLILGDGQLIKLPFPFSDFQVLLSMSFCVWKIRISWTPPPVVKMLQNARFFGFQFKNSQNIESDETKYLAIVCSESDVASIGVKKHVSFGDAIYGKTHQQQIVISNIGSTTLKYSALINSPNLGFYNQIEIFRNQSGEILPGHSVDVELSFLPSKIGKFETFMLVRNENCDSDFCNVSLTASVIFCQSRFILYPDLICDDMGKLNKLDLGLLQIPFLQHSTSEAEFKYVLRLVNVYSEDLMVSAVSNLKKQCFVFSDAECTIPAHFFPLKPFQMSSLHVVLRPSSLSHDDAELGRELRGGIRLMFFQRPCRFCSHDLQSNLKLYDSSIVFNAILGRSKFRIHMPSRCFRVSPMVTSSHVGVIRGSFKIENISLVFPVKYALQLPHGGIVTTNSADDMLGKNIFRFEIIEGREGTIDSHCCQSVHYALYFREISGLAFISVDVLNLFTQESQTLELSFFFDASVVRSSFLRFRENNDLMSTIPKNLIESNILYSRNVFVERFPSVKLWNPVWILPFDGKVSDVSCNFIPGNDAQLGDYITCGQDRKLYQWEIHNPRDKPVRMSPISNLPIKISHEILSAHSSDAHCNVVPSGGNTGLKRTRNRSFASEQQRTMISIPSELSLHGFTICGDPITILPLQRIIVHVFSSSEINIDISRVHDKIHLRGAIAFLSAAQTLESFFNPDPLKQASKLIASKEINSVHPVLSYLPVSCQLVIPALNVLNSDIRIDNIRHYTSTSVVVEIECGCDYDVPFRIENIPSWMIFSATDGAMIESMSKASLARISSSTPVLVAGAKKVTHVHFGVIVSKSWSSGSISHCIRLKNLALAVSSNSSIIRDCVNIDVTLEYDATFALLLKDSRGNQSPMREKSHNQMLKLDTDGIPCCPRISDTEVHTTFFVQNTTSLSLSIVQSLSVPPILGSIVSINLVNPMGEIGDIKGNDVVVLPGGTFELSVLVKPLLGSHIDRTVLESLVRWDIEDNEQQHLETDDCRSNSEDERESDEFRHGVMDSLLLGRVSLAYACTAVANESCGRILEDSIDFGEIKIDIVGPINPLPTTFIKSSTVFDVKVLIFEVDVDLDRDGMLQGRHSLLYELYNLVNMNTTFKTKSSLVKIMKHESESLDHFRCLIAKEDYAISLCPKNEGLLASSEDGSPFELSLSLSPVDSDDTLLDDFSKLRDMFLSQVGTGFDDTDSTQGIAEAYVAVYDESNPAHTPLVCRVVIRPTQPLENDPCCRYKKLQITDFQNVDGNASLDIPILRLRGVGPCNSSGSLHEINMGQQVSQTHDIEWTLALENLSTKRPLTYKISTLSGNDTKWLAVMQSTGVINKEGMASVVLHFVRNRLGMYSTYLLIENLSNLHDICIVRVTMEVVQDWMKMRKSEDGTSSYHKHFVLHTPLQYIGSEQSLRLYNRGKDFMASVKSRSLEPASLEATPTLSDQNEYFIDFGDVFVGHIYTRRSFSVENISDIVLDFHLSSTFPSSELSFSLAPVSPRSVSRISVLPGENRIVYLIFKPSSHHGEFNKALIAGGKIPIFGMVFVSCKLLKNHHETFQICARVFDASIDVTIAPSTMPVQDGRSKHCLQMNLRGPGATRFNITTSNSAEATANYKWHASNCLSVKNMCSERDLIFTVYSCMVCFELKIFTREPIWSETIQAWSSELNGGNGTSVDVSLRPGGEFDIEVTFLETIFQKYNSPRDRLNESGSNHFIGAEDHFMIYNRNNPAERCRVPIRLLIPRDERNFPNCKESMTVSSEIPEVPISFAALEGIIASYLKEFTGFWGDVLDLDSSSKLQMSGSDLGLQNDALWSDETQHRNSKDVTSATPAVTLILNKFFSDLQPLIKLSDSGIMHLDREDVNFPQERGVSMTFSHRFANLFLHFHAITDMLVLHTMRQSSHGHEIMTSARTGLPVARLALLLYTVVFRHPIFQTYAHSVSDMRDSDIAQSSSTLPLLLLPFCKLPIYYSSFFYESSGECQLLVELREFVLRLYQKTAIT